ncbi:MAG: serine/threonine protein kinase [Deltaproteobacteria bacterium]|nr:serine/threonine protein kinase [Deltaproteobacteria bacterium]
MMTVMVPDDRPRDQGSAPRDPATASARAPGNPAAADSDEAFAATIAPMSTASLPHGTVEPPPIAANGQSQQQVAARVEHELAQTLAAPAVGALPPLPIVSDAHYKLDGEIARGGMGRIVAAEDQRLGRPVALKELLEPAGDALGRFQREALITARLQHPGIVPVYEAGRWPTGEPFFAMKLVSGRPLDRVIAEARTLTDRLALLPRIAAATDAIAYAHSQRVVHRDLKPANVLIGDFGETVVIDWGLAKDLDAGDSPDSATRLPRPTTNKPTTTINTGNAGTSTLTVVGAVMGTPAYMAPEQARGEPVDQRADVFALGAMLYHLLAGVPPYNARTATDVIAAAALARVVPLAERESGAPRDLVAIVERAMAPELVDRYRHAGELADELRRFLTGQLVSAHRYTTGQRIGRFIKKHRAAVTIATIAVLTFAGTGTLAVRQIMQQRDAAQYARLIADTRRVAAETLIDSMLSDVKERLIQIGRLDLLANLGGQIRDYYATLETIPGGMPPGDVDRMATAVELVGRAERDSGDTDRALKTWTDARSQIASLVGDVTTAETRGARAMIARLDYQIATIYQGRGKSAAALASYTKAKAEFGGLLGEVPKDRQILLHSADNHDRLGDLLRNDGKIDQAFEEYSEAKSQRERATIQASTRPSDEVLALSTSHLKLGSVYQARGDSATALAEYRAGLRLRETLLETEPDNVELQERVLDVQDTLAELQRQIGDDRSAIETYQRSVPVIDAMIRRDPTNMTWKRQRANLMADLGFALLDSGEFGAGLGKLEDAIASERELVARDPKNTSWQVDLSRSYTRGGDGHLYLGAPDDAIAKYEAGLGLRRKLATNQPTSAPYRRSLAWSYTKLANAYAFKNDLERARDSYEHALTLRQQLVTDAPSQSGYKNELASTEVNLGKLLVPRDPRRGAELVASGLQRARALVAADPINNEWKETVVQGLLAHAEAGRAPDDRNARRAALEEARSIATAAAERAPQNAHWPGYLAEVHAGLAELAADRKAVAAEWKAVRDLLEPLDKAGRLSAVRKILLERARAAR